jgi:hypothetical protein
MGFSIPAQYYPHLSELLVGIMNSRLERLSGLDIKTAEVVGGQLHIAGTIPAKAQRSEAP